MSAVELLRYPSADALAEVVSRRLLDELDVSRKPAVTCSVALSGGRIAARFFSALAHSVDAVRLGAFPVHFFWADERCVPPDDLHSNFGLARSLLLDPIGVPSSRIHRIHGEDVPEAAAAAAEAELRRVSGTSTGVPVLDLALLGMGEDGHVASLFPGEGQDLRDSPAIFRAVMSPKPPPQRITISYCTLAAARQVWVLASGSGKQEALREALSRNGRSPLARLLELRSHTDIFTDIPLHATA